MMKDDVEDFWEADRDTVGDASEDDVDVWEDDAE